MAFTFSFAGDDIDFSADADVDLDSHAHANADTEYPEYYECDCDSDSDDEQERLERRALALAIEHDTPVEVPRVVKKKHAAETGSLGRKSDGKGSEKGKGNGEAKATAFPIPGGNLLPVRNHGVRELLGKLPSSIGYGCLRVEFGGGDDTGSTQNESSSEEKTVESERRARPRRKSITLLRRDIWDIRVQVMAEAEMRNGDGNGEEDEDAGLGKDDVKTGVYEGGFKSWESSVDLVKWVEKLDLERSWLNRNGGRVLEMGCGTALPTLSIFQSHLENAAIPTNQSPPKLSLTFADYNPTVLYLVTLPNILLTWARHQHNINLNQPQKQNQLSKDETSKERASEWASEGELDITPELLESFLHDLQARNIELNFISGAWSTDFVFEFTRISTPNKKSPLLILAAETIYSPFALETFTTTLMDILFKEYGNGNGGGEFSYALVAAKKVYFGVGGSLEDFYTAVREGEGVVSVLGEETEGVRREVARVER